MKLRSLIWMVLGVFLVSLLFLALPNESYAAREWKYALEEIQGSVQDHYAQEYKKRVEEQLKDVTIIVYPYGALGTSEDISELTMNGMLEFCFATPGHLGTFIPAARVFSLPFIWSDNLEANKYVAQHSKAIYEMLAKEYEKYDLKLLAAMTEGWQIWTANKPIRTPADMKNFKIRIMGDPILAETYKAYGANPIQVPYSDIYSSLQLGMIEGNIQPYFAHEEMHFYEVQNYFIEAKEMPFFATVVANKQFFESLSKEEQEVIEQTARDCIEYIWGVQAKLNEERLEKMLNERPQIQVIKLTEEERQAFKDLTKPVIDKYIEMSGDTGKQILDQLLKEIAEAEEMFGK